MHNNGNFVGVILAAGEGTRMKSLTPKVLQNVSGRPMLDYVIQAVKGAEVKKILVVVGFKGDMIKDIFKDSMIGFVTQEKRLGTAHAVLQTAPYLNNFSGNCLILCGDTPLITSQTLRNLIEIHERESAGLTLLSANLENPSGYGRILRDNENKVAGIIEEKDATDEQRCIKEINTGIYCFKCNVMFELLARIGRDNAQGEYYLTDCVSLAKEAGIKISNFLLTDSREILGVNRREELLIVEDLLKKKDIKT